MLRRSGHCSGSSDSREYTKRKRTCNTLGSPTEALGSKHWRHKQCSTSIKLHIHISNTGGGGRGSRGAKEIVEVGSVKREERV